MERHFGQSHPHPMGVPWGELEGGGGFHHSDHPSLRLSRVAQVVVTFGFTPCSPAPGPTACVGASFPKNTVCTQEPAHGYPPAIWHQHGVRRYQRGVGCREFRGEPKYVCHSLQMCSLDARTHCFAAPEVHNFLQKYHFRVLCWG